MISLFARKFNNLCLFVPPCQGVCFAIARECFDVFLLLLCARDVETNLGPNTLDKTKPKILDDVLPALATLQQGQNSILKEMKSFRDSLMLMNKSVKTFSDKVSSIEQSLPALKPLSEDVWLCSSASIIESNMAGLSALLGDLKTRSHQNNHFLWFYGH